ncbi:MAG: hypothetical protein KAS72_07095 [Phycisphaerales bacterium]|nr:hypothetical protein [Phycisphaerales bacterium]
MTSRRVVVSIVACIILVLTIASLCAWVLARATPRWWRTIDPNSQETKQIAENIERGFTSLLSQSRPRDTVWAFRVTASQANAWLNTRLPLWLANLDEPVQWPASLRQVQVNFDEGVIRIGALVRDDQGERIIAASVEPRLEAGRFACPAVSVGAGQLDLPAGLLLPKIRRSMPDDVATAPFVEQLFALLADERTTDAVIKLEDDRRIHMLDIKLQDGALIVTCRTEWPG